MPQIDSDSYEDATAVLPDDEVLMIQDGAFVRAKAGLLSPAGKILVVDQVNGSDSTGSRAYRGRPFATPEAANDAALAGDFVSVLPGTFTLTEALGKNGVNWHLMPGVTLTADSTADAVAYVFNDAGSAMTFKVSGAGVLRVTGIVPDSDTPCACVRLANSSSVVRMECSKLDMAADPNSNNAFGSAVYHLDGSLRIDCDTITAADGFCAWWLNGDSRIIASEISSGGDATLYASCSSTPTGDFFVSAESIANTNPSGTTIDGFSPNAEAKFWVQAKLISSIFHAVGLTGGKTYIDAQKMSGNTASTTSGIIDVQSGTPQYWIRVMKIAGTYGYAVKQSVAATGFLSIQQVENLGSMSGSYSRSAGTLTVNGSSI